jgi:hypothetical protein
MTMNATTAAPLVTRILHLPITCDAEAFVTVARATERAVVQLGSPGAEHRDTLDRFVVRGIEARLVQLGAAPPGWHDEDGLESIASDQLYRARLLGHSGLALSFASLSALADGNGHLGADDSSTLRRLVTLAEREPLQLYLPKLCAELHVIGDPEPLSTWLPPSLQPGRVASIEYDDPANAADQPEVLHCESSSPALLPPRLEAFVDGHAATELATPELVQATGDSPVGETRSPRRLSVDVEAWPDAEAPLRSEPEHEALVEAEHGAHEVEHAAEAKSPSDPARTEPETNPSDPPAEPVRADPQRIQRCISWATQLQGMSGPRVHGSVEKAFITAYLPLCREIAAGTAPTEAVSAAEKWAEGFAQGYASAHRQLGSHARRPRMVKDVVDVGVRWLAQHQARQCQLLLVTAMRFDLSQRLNEELERRFAGGAVCADQCVLWTALPSNAEAQLLGDAERAAARKNRSEPQRPPSAAVIEPVRVGNRGLFKLSHVPQELSRAGEAEAARLERLAVELADGIVPWMREQPPDTLIVIFGDHGFHWQSTPLGTSAAQRGGALPEQVLVSASGWMLCEPRHKARVAPGVH